MTGRAERRQVLPLVLAAVVFFAGGVTAIQDGQTLLGVTDLVAGLLNLAALFLARHSSRLTAIGVNVVNAAVALVLVVTSIQAGKHYIQYAWTLAAAFFVIAAVASYRRR